MAAVTLQSVTTLLAQLGGLSILAGTLAGSAALVYRWYVSESVPRGLALLIGLSGVALYLNTTTALGDVIGGATAPTAVQAALFNIAAFAAGGAGADTGRRVGDRFEADVVFGSESGTQTVDDVGRLVRTLGRVVEVELPEEIDDVVGYDPVASETKGALAGRSFVFPKNVTVGELEERLVGRLRRDYAVGHVDVDLAADGTVEYLALGSRAAGIGPTLPPATTAVAIRADPAFSASAGDLVQVWETDPMRRVLTAELRGVADDVVTVAIDAADTPKVDPTSRYRLVTLPVKDRPDREFASLLRAADETFSSVTVEAGSPLAGNPVGAVSLSVVAVTPAGGETVALPARDHVLEAGDLLFAIAKPDGLRRLETAARGVPSALESTHPPTARDAPGSPGGPSDQAVHPETSADALDPADGAGPDRSDPREKVTDGDSTSIDAGDSPPVETPEAESDAGDSSDREDPDVATGDEIEPNAEDAGPADGPETTDDSFFDDDLSGLDVGDDGEPDDLDALSFDEDEADSFSLDLDDEFEEEEGDDATHNVADASADDEPSDDDGSDPEEKSGADDGDDTDGDEEGADEDDGDDADADDGSGASGGGTFAELKEEFESGDADWADGVDDSPGGDMRLDE